MDEKKLKNMLEKVSRGDLKVDQALEFLKRWPAEDLGYAVIDHQRSLRKGFPEVIFCQEKESGEICEIFEKMSLRSPRVLATRVPPPVARKLVEDNEGARHNPRAGTVSLSREEPEVTEGLVSILTAGTSDIPVAEEAKETAAIMGSRVETFYDVGVAGLHRVLGRGEHLGRARVLVVAAGMDGALASVVGGLFQAPIIAVPTSVGYGASFQGLSPLLTMLNSCAPGVAVVNIDNGFGAGYLAHVINLIGEKKE
jgi:NCAIR mutase (PurE)-related protein